MKKIITLFLFFTCLSVLGQEKIYYDANWQETTSKDYVYYRPLPLKKVGELLYIQDYYKNGQLQYQGYSYQDDENARVGDVYWYTEEGFDSNTGHYENMTGTKELTYYYPNGKQWKKILYNNKGEKQLETVFIDGKEPIVGEYYNEDYYGIFIYRKFSDDYYSIKRNRHIEKDSIKLNNQKKYLPNDIQNYNEVIYWSNGNKAKETLYSNTAHSKRKSLISIDYWDINGKAISSTNTIFNYYTKFGIAQAVKSKVESRPKDTKWSDQITTYYPNGKIKKINRSTWRNTEIYSYDEKGKESIQLLKERRAPYDGHFTDTVGNKVTYYQMIKGQKIGEAITKNFKSDTIVAKGIFKENKPHNGSFFLRNDKLHLLQYVEGVQEGVQKQYNNYYTDKPTEVYEMKKGLLNGFKRTYKDGILLTDESYKDGAPINATVIEGRTKRTYKDAVLYSIGYYKKDYSDKLTDLQYIEYYVNNVIDHVVYDTFRIIEDMRTSYTGYYKDEKPYKGYFISEEIIIDKIPLINYYENGVLVAQYSLEFLEQKDTFNKLLYNQKATFKNGKVVDGYRYITDENSRGMLLKIRYKNSDINMIELNLFGMHAFKRIMFELKNNELFIIDFSNPTYIKIRQDNKYLKAELYNAKGKIPNKEQPVVKDKTPNSEKTFYIEDNKVKSYSVVSFSDEYYKSLKEENSSLLISSTYYNFPRFLNLSPTAYFSQYTNFVDQIINMNEGDNDANQKEQNNSLYAILQNAALNNNRIAQLVYNDKGTPSQGINITYTNNKYTVDYYLEDKLLKTAYHRNINELTEGKLFIEFIEIVQKQH